MDRDQVAAAIAAVGAEMDAIEADTKRRLDVLYRRRAALEEVLATFAEPLPVGAVVKEVTERKPKAKRGGAIPSHSEEVSCPDCGQRMRRGGLGPHRARKHPNSAAKPVEPVTPAPEPETVDDVDDKPLVFKCGDCGFQFSRELTLERHVEDSHGRELRAAERMRVQAA